MDAGVGDEATTREDLARQGTIRLKLSWKKMSSLWSKLVWGLLSLPIIFYHIPVEEVRLQSS